MIKLFTSESVTSGHPDKICDFIADHILDAALEQDPKAHMAVEATIKDNFILVYGEANTTAKIPYEDIAKSTLKQIGYEEEYEVLVKVNQQSSEINHAVDHSEMGAGDQGIMFGYACDETENAMPLAIDLAHRLAQQLETVRRKTPFLKPDGKTQVTIAYENDQPKYIDTIVISTQHTADVDQKTIYQTMIDQVITPIIPASYIQKQTKFIINPSGSFILGGSFADSGTTGRKIVVDSYGGYAPIGGGCFSSKDPSKVDRTAAYYARYVCKNLVAHGLVKKCQLQLSYAIGKSAPVSIHLETFQTHQKPLEEIYSIIERNFNFHVGHMIEELDLQKPIYHLTTNYGHFGKPNLPWEKVKPVLD